MAIYATGPPKARNPNRRNFRNNDVRVIVGVVIGAWAVPRRTSMIRSQTAGAASGADLDGTRLNGRPRKPVGHDEHRDAHYVNACPTPFPNDAAGDPIVCFRQKAATLSGSGRDIGRGPDGGPDGQA